jgi:hypothetical protein
MDEPDLAPRASHLRRATRQDSASHGGDTPGFPELMAEVMASAVHFGHRQHIHLTWLAVRRYGTAAAVELVSDGIQTTARYAGVPQKYNATVSRAWVELVGYHAAEQARDDFAAFAEHHTALLDKRLLTRFYRPMTLASTRARTGWVEPDLAAFPPGNTDRRPLGPRYRGPEPLAPRPQRSLLPHLVRRGTGDVRTWSACDQDPLERRIACRFPGRFAPGQAEPPVLSDRD